MMARDKADRPQSSSDVREALESARRERPGTARRQVSSDSVTGMSARRLTVLTVDLVGFRAHADEQPLPRTFFMMESWRALVDEAVEAHGGVVVRQDAAQLSAIFSYPNKSGDHPMRAVRALRDLKQALDAFNRTHGRRESFTAGLESGPLFVGVLEAQATPACFGAALDTSVRLAKVRHLGVGMVGPALTESLSSTMAIEPLIGVADDLSSASVIPAEFLG